MYRSVCRDSGLAYDRMGLSADIKTSVWRQQLWWNRGPPAICRPDLELNPRLIDHVTAHLPRRSVTVSAQTREIDVTQLSCFYTALEPDDSHV